MGKHHTYTSKGKAEEEEQHPRQYRYFPNDGSSSYLHSSSSQPASNPTTSCTSPATDPSNVGHSGLKKTMAPHASYSTLYCPQLVGFNSPINPEVVHNTYAANNTALPFGQATPYADPNNNQLTSALLYHSVSGNGNDQAMNSVSGTGSYGASNVASTFSQCGSYVDNNLGTSALTQLYRPQYATSTAQQPQSSPFAPQYIRPPRSMGTQSYSDSPTYTSGALLQQASAFSDTQYVDDDTPRGDFTVPASLPLPPARPSHSGISPTALGTMATLAINKYCGNCRIDIHICLFDNCKEWYHNFPEPNEHQRMVHREGPTKQKRSRHASGSSPKASKAPKQPKEEIRWRYEGCDRSEGGKPFSRTDNRDMHVLMVHEIKKTGRKYRKSGRDDEWEGASDYSSARRG